MIDRKSDPEGSWIETLVGAAVDGELDRVVGLLSSLDEPARQAAYGPARALYEHIPIRSRWKELPPAWCRRLRAGSDPALVGARDATTLALDLGLGPRPSFVRFGPWRAPAVDRALAQVLADRQPDWLEDWAASAVEDDLAYIDWPLIDRLVRLGALTRPESPIVPALQAWDWIALHRWGDEPKPQAYDRLLAEPERLGDLWDLFEADIRSHIWHAEDDGGDQPLLAGREGLATTFHRLIEAGRVPRERALDATLHALLDPRSGSHRKSLVRFHRQLAPRREEIVTRQAAYRALLGTGSGPVAELGLVALAGVARGGELELDGFVSAVGPVFAIAARAPAKRALSLLATLLASAEGPQQRERLLIAVADGLLHPATPVAETALETLQARAPLPKAVREAVAAARPGVAGVLLGRLDPLLGRPEPEEGTSEELRPPRLTGPPRPDLQRLEKLPPVEDREALLDLAYRAAELVESADQVERLLDGLARFGSDRSGRLMERTEPLRRRLAEPADPARPLGLARAYESLALALRDLLRTWLEGDRVRSNPERVPSERGPIPFLLRRLREVEDRVLGLAPAGPLSAMPTHAGGWLDPGVLAERLTALDDDGRAAAMTSADLCQALGRLAPGAPELAREVPGDAGRLLRFALGGEDAADRPGAGDDRAVEAWVSAARRRDPAADLAADDGLLAGLLPPLGRHGRRPGSLLPFRW
ncbi:MAG: DUF6493 family protein, partial [Holophagales bacterium]|nr:DUF6493 family protein [Holophagales bacterium]